jgi:hypothetical protein
VLAVRLVRFFISFFNHVRVGVMAFFIMITIVLIAVLFLLCYFLLRAVLNFVIVVDLSNYYTKILNNIDVRSHGVTI